MPLWLVKTRIPLFFAVLALVFVGPGLLPGRALLPIDNLFLYPPWQAHAADYGVRTPHNPLIGDAILQNYSWKRFAAESFAAGELPLWNPYLLAGQPFLAAAQNGSLYPPGVLFFILPLAHAYAWFIGLHLWIGALGAYWLARLLGATRLGGVVAGITFGFCGFLVVSFLWPMVVSTAVWLPWLLGAVERVVRRSGWRAAADPGSSPHPDPLPEEEGVGSVSVLIALGAVVVGLQFLAGHLEMSLYLLISAGLYTALRLVPRLRVAGVGNGLGAGMAALGMVAIGGLLAAIQLVPFAEAISANVRTGWADYAETVGYAMTRDRLVAWVVPDYFGNPSHHTYLDLFDGQIRSVEHVRPAGEPRSDTEWGAKNYVESTAYVGILPLVLALVALVRGPGPGGWAMAGLALISVLLAFGTPLYALLFYGVPGVNQLHTPFRWTYPLSLCLAILAGLGAGVLTQGWEGRTRRFPAPAVSARRLEGVGLSVLGIGLALVAALVGVLLFRGRAADLAQRALGRWPDLRAGFGEPEVLLSYQFWNLSGSALLAVAVGAIVWLGVRGRSRLAGGLGVAILVADLFSFGIGFNSVSETRALDLVPSAIRAIKADTGLYRVVTYGEDDTLPSNTNMLFGLQDVRGYDTLILKDYVDYLERIEPQRGIEYSKVAKLFDQRSLSSPLLDLLNVKYVLTSKTVSQPNWTLFHQSEGIRVYRNERALPRAFVVAGAVPAANREAALALVGDPAFDPSRTAVLEGWARPLAASAGSVGSAEVVEYGGNRVRIRAVAPAGGFLVLGDVFFPGWSATVNGEPRAIMRANALVRAVELPPGEHNVVFEYRPLSLRVGALLSLVGVVVLLALVALPMGARLLRADETASPVQRVARNSAFPLATSLLNKVMDVGFALIMFRILQAEGVGAYTFAGVLVGYFDILVGFGLGTLITREVARNRERAGEILGNTLVVRLALWLLSAGVAAVLTGPGADGLGITPPIALTIWLLVLAVLPGIASSALTSLLQGYERMELPALVTVVTTILKVTLGVLALLGGFGYVGLAAVALINSSVTALVLAALFVRVADWPRLRVSTGTIWWMAGISLPLLLNDLLNSLFFRIDAILLKPMAGDAALGWYSTAYKFIDGLQIVPASFVLAVFPLMARQAHADRHKLAEAVRVSLKTLLLIAFPIAVGTALLADWIILLFAGASYLPESALALQVLIWFLPVSFVNGLVQYVLIALNRQRWITLSFLLGAGFNLAANLVLIPRYGYLGASAVTVVSELVLLAPFWLVIRKELPPISLPALIWRPATAAAIMGGAVWLLAGWSPLLAVPVGGMVYVAAALALGAVSREDREALRHALFRRGTVAS